jgi:hypothetical protein
MATVLITVISGVFVFIISQIFSEVYLKPLQEYRKLRCKVSHIMTRTAQYYCNPITYEAAQKFQDKYAAVADELRDLAAEIRGFIETVPPSFRPGIPAQKDIYDASATLIGLSNSLWIPKGSEQQSRQISDNKEWQKEIYKKFKIFKTDD